MSATAISAWFADENLTYRTIGENQRASGNQAGITLMGARPCHPATGRFLSVDPVAGSNCNVYDYVGTNPLSQQSECLFPQGRQGTRPDPGADELATVSAAM